MVLESGQEWRECAGPTLADRVVESQWDMEGQLASWGGASCLSHALLCGGFGLYGQHMFFLLFSLPSYHFVTSNTFPSHLAQASCIRGVGRYSQELEACG